MTDSDIQDRQIKAHFWMLGALFLMVVWGVAWGVIEVWQGQASYGPSTMSSVALSDPTMGPMSKAAAMKRFLRFVQAGPGAQAEPAHEYARMGFYLLSRTLRSEIAPRPDPLIIQHEQVLQTVVDQLDALSSQAPVGPVRAASLATADLLAALQAAHYPLAPAQVDAVHAAALAIQPQASLHEQRAALQTFFQRSAAALEPVSKMG